jgi:hypothetical protein
MSVHLNDNPITRLARNSLGQVSRSQTSGVSKIEHIDILYSNAMYGEGNEEVKIESVVLVYLVLVVVVVVGWCSRYRNCSQCSQLIM